MTRRGAPEGTDPLTTCTASAGVVVAPLLDGGLAYDAAAGRAHLLDRTAAWLLAAAATPVTMAALVDQAVSVTGADRATVTADLTSGIDALRDLGLLDRTDAYAPPSPPTGSDRRAEPSWSQGGVHAVLDHGIRFRGPDAGLVAEIDAFLGTALDDRAATLLFDVEPAPDGGIVLTTADGWRFPHRSGFYAQLLGVINEYAARSHGLAVLHAGAVRTPTGEVLLVSGAIDAGKSTVISSLVGAGCDYLGDESIAIRPGTLDLVAYPKPLTLDATSRAVLGLEPSPAPHVDVTVLRSDVERLVDDVGPLTGVILAEYVGPRPTNPQGGGGAEGVARLSAREAIQALLGNTLNLGRAGLSGLEDLCRVAESVPVLRVRHRDSVAVAKAIVAEGLEGLSGGAPDARGATPS